MLHCSRISDAKLKAVSPAVNKAFTDAGQRAPTTRYGDAAFLPGRPANGIHNSNAGRFAMIAGGVLVEVDGVVVGAAGMSGGTPGQDVGAAAAGWRG